MGTALFSRCRRGGGLFLDWRCAGSRFGWFRWRIGGPEMPITCRALPELIWRPRVFWPRVAQIHLGAASLATNTDVGMVHGEILVSRPSGTQHDSQAGYHACVVSR
jgi:hypothetical protein